MRLLKVLLAHVAAFGFAAAVSSSCAVNYPSTAFRCDPSGPDPACPDSYVCCSDDASAMNLDALTGALPDYSQSPSEERMPLFSNKYNDFSTSGMCVKEGAVGDSGLGLAPSCPVPCNPRWTGAEIDDVCGGGGFLCCQTTELAEKDCIYLEEFDCVRPAMGSDVWDTDQTDWGTSKHETHQGPNGKSCDKFLAAEDLDTDHEGEAFRACVRQLTVADQRGFCLREDPANGVTACPAESESYVDACENWAFENGKDMCAGY